MATTKTAKTSKSKTSTKKAEPAAKSAAPKKGKRKAADEEEEASTGAEGEGEEEEEDEDLAPRAKAGKPVVEPAPMVQARRLTPEAKQRINDMVAKGVPLGEAMLRAASWETFIAPAREDQTKAAPGGTRFESGGRSVSVGGGEDDEFSGGGSFEVDDDAPATATDDD